MPALHRHVDRGLALANAHIVDAKARPDVTRRDDIGRPRAARNPDSQPIADEIFAEPLDAGVGDNPAFLDLRIDEIGHAPFGRAFAGFIGIEANAVANFQEAGMLFRQSQPQLEILLRDRHERIAGQNHRTNRHQAFQYPPVLRSENLPLRLLLLDNTAFGHLGAEIVLGDVEKRSRLVEPGARKRAPLGQPFDAVKIGLRLISLSLQRLDLRIERFRLQHELLVANDGNRLAARHRVALPDVKLRDRTADAAACRHHADAFHGGKDRLFVRDRALLD